MRVMLFGPPGAGKTVAAQALAGAVGHVLYLDDHVERLKRSDVTLNLPLSDQALESAIYGLLAEAAQQATCLVEVAHHDFDRVSRLCAGLWTPGSAQFVVLHAPLCTLLSRNRSRPPANQIPEVYLLRCLHETLRVIECIAEDAVGFGSEHCWITDQCVFDTSRDFLAEVVGGVNRSLSDNLRYGAELE